MCILATKSSVLLQIVPGVIRCYTGPKQNSVDKQAKRTANMYIDKFIRYSYNISINTLSYVYGLDRKL